VGIESVAPLEDDVIRQALIVARLAPAETSYSSRQDLYPERPYFLISAALILLGVQKDDKDYCEKHHHIYQWMYGHD